MILSSADIQRILGGDPVIRQEARISIVDTKPGFGLDEYVYIYIERYPAVDEFEATWRLWVHNGGSDVLDLVLAAMTRLLPNFEFQREGLYSTTDFKSEKTVVRPAEEIALEKVARATGTIEQRFSALEKTVLDRLAAVRDGIDGQDGQDGAPGIPGATGAPGRDGRDIVATDAKLEDLQNVDQNIAKEDGQVLTWKDGVWQNLFIPQIISSISGGGSGKGEANSDTINSETAPTTRVDGSDLREGDSWFKTTDGTFYVRYTGNWIEVSGGGGGGLPLGSYLNQPLTWNGSSWSAGSSVQLDVSNTQDVGEGELSWESDEHTAILGINGIHAHIGHDQFAWCRNNTASTIPRGTCVMFDGTLGNSGRLLIAPMVADGSHPGYVFLGIAAEDIAPGVDGNVYSYGKIKQVNTASFSEGAILWCDPSVPGGLTPVEPAAPNLKLPVAAVISSAANGVLMVRSTTGQRLRDLHDVEIDAPAEGEVLAWDETNQRWQNQLLSNSLLGRGIWRFSSATAGAPASGRVQLDNVDASLVSTVDVSRYNSDGQDVYELLPALVKTGSILYLQSGDADNYFLYNVVADAVQTGSTHLSISVSLQASGPGASFTNNASVFLSAYGAGGVSTNSLTIDDVRLDAEDQVFGYSNGDLVSVTGTEVQISITYNPDGSIATVAKTSNGATVTKAFGYDANGNLTSTTVS